MQNLYIILLRRSKNTQTIGGESLTMAIKEPEFIEHKRYKKAPLFEALIDINVEFKEEIEINKLEAFELQIYPTKDKILVHTSQIQIGNANKQIHQSEDLLGFKLTSTDKKYVVQIKKNGFTFSELNGYDCWESFISKAKEAWDRYFDAFNPVKVTRVTLRYINKINIPALKFHLEDYFETYPRVFKDNKVDLSNFFLQVQIPQTEEGGLAILNQTVTEPSEPGYTSILFDINVFDPKQIESIEKDLWKRVDLLRIQKNHLFENSITDKTRELFS